MKKFFKLLIALVLITGLSVGAFFVFKNKDNSKKVYNNVYELTYNVKDKNKNITKSVDDTVNNMLTVISEKGIDVGDAKNTLVIFKNLSENYALIRDEILASGDFVTANTQVNDYINNAGKALKNVKNVYRESYDYLVKTYYKIVDTDYNKETMKTYIINFEVVFKDILTDYNNFYYNCGVAYSHLLNNMMTKNNAYKLQIEYLSTLVNNYYSATDAEKTTYISLINNCGSYLNTDLMNEYFENKSVYDNLIDNSISLNVPLLCEKLVAGEKDAYIASLEDETTKQMVTNYFSKVVRG